MCVCVAQKKHKISAYLQKKNKKSAAARLKAVLFL